MADTGFKSPTSTGEDHNQWTAPANAYTSNNQRASEPTTDHQQDYYDFTFGVPTGAIIKGIEVVLEAQGDDMIGYGNINVALSYDGGPNYTSEKNTGELTGSDADYTLGGSTDTWGRTWSVSEFGNTYFRLRVTARNTLFGVREVRIDHIEVKVYYTLTKTFTADGIVKVTSTKTFTADGVVRETKTLGFTADGYIVEQKTFTTDGIVKEIKAKTFTIDGVVEAVGTQTFTTDGIIKVPYYRLDTLILPRPDYLKREYIFLKEDMKALDGKTSRDKVARKEKYILSWDALTSSQLSNILEIAEKNEPVTFSVKEKNLTIDETNVIVNLKSIRYSVPGDSYLAETEVELIEVE